MSIELFEEPPKTWGRLQEWTGRGRELDVVLAAPPAAVIDVGGVAVGGGVARGGGVAGNLSRSTPPVAVALAVLVQKGQI